MIKKDIDKKLLHEMTPKEFKQWVNRVSVFNKLSPTEAVHRELVLNALEMGWKVPRRVLKAHGIKR